jgi:uncharacterized membrane protein YccC
MSTTITVPTISNWRTTLFGILTAVGGAVMQWYQHGVITWQGGVACALWAIFCYLVPDAKSNTNAQAQLEALLDQVSGLQAQLPAPQVQARTDAPATDTQGKALGAV